MLLFRENWAGKGSSVDRRVWHQNKGCMRLPNIIKKCQIMINTWLPTYRYKFPDMCRKAAWITFWWPWLSHDQLTFLDWYGFQIQYEVLVAKCTIHHIIWIQSDHQQMAIWWMSDDRLIIIWWLSDDCVMTVLWLSDDSLMTN